LVVDWEVPSYDMGFDSDTSPELRSLFVDSLAGRKFEDFQRCEVVVTLHPEGESSARYFYGPAHPGVARRPRLEMVYDSPTTAEQLLWTSDQACDVSVSVPMPPNATDTCDTVDAASGRAIADTSECPHLMLSAIAATTLESCAMTANGLNLFADAGFALDRIVTGRDGVCAAMLGGGAAGSALPRAACFDTQAEGVGAEQLAAWIDTIPTGATAMVVSCSRAAFNFKLSHLSEAFGLLGAVNTPKYVLAEPSLIPHPTHPQHALFPSCPISLLAGPLLPQLQVL